MSWPKVLVGVTAALAANSSMFAYAARANKQHADAISKLPAEQQRALRVRDYALRNNAWYHSGDPYLRTMAIAGYDAHPYLKTQANFQLSMEESRQKLAQRMSQEKPAPSTAPRNVE